MTKDLNIWFKLFASCILVKGVTSSIIYDVERRSFYDFPNNFIEIMEMTNKMNIYSIKKAFGNDQDDLIDAFLDQFVGAEIGFYTSEPDNYPSIDFTWDYPSVITNSIIEFDSKSDFDLKKIIQELDYLGCKAIQLRFLYSISTQKLMEYMTFFNDLRIKHIDILLPYTKTLIINSLHLLAIKQPRINRILVYSSPNDEIISNENEALDQIIIFLKKNIHNDPLEIINVDRFVTNIEIFSEALNHNLGLNRKVCICSDGEIKNYINHIQSYGNVKYDDIKAIVSKTEFKIKWFISNDEIEICKDCQYRYACVSNSDIKKENNFFYKLEMCNYSPKLNEWGIN